LYSAEQPTNSNIRIQIKIRIIQIRLNVNPSQYSTALAPVTNVCAIGLHYNNLLFLLYRVQSYSLHREYQNSFQIFVIADSAVNSDF